MPADQRLIDYLVYLKECVVRDERALVEAEKIFAAARAKVDDTTPFRTDPDDEEATVAWLTARQGRTAVSFWYSDVMHYHNAITARSTLILALEAIQRMQDEAQRHAHNVRVPRQRSQPGR